MVSFVDRRKVGRQKRLRQRKRRACSAQGSQAKDAPGEGSASVSLGLLTPAREDAIVSEAFRLATPAVKVYLRFQVRRGASALSAVESLKATLSQIELAGRAVKGISDVVRVFRKR